MKAAADLGAQRRVDLGQGEDGGGHGPDAVAGDQGRGHQRRRNQRIRRVKELPDAQDHGADGHVDCKVGPAKKFPYHVGV